MEKKKGKTAPKKSTENKKKAPVGKEAAVPEEEKGIIASGIIGLESADVVGVLDKFRSKLLVTLLLLVVLTPVAFYFSDILLYYINKPFLDTGNKLNIFTLMGGFMLRFKVSVAAALFVLAPVIIFQVWSIIATSLMKTSRLFSVLMFFVAVVLFYSGILFVFFMLLPATIEVMLGFVGKDMLSTIGADNYLGFILFFGLAMGLLFEIPVIIFVLTRIGLISPSMLTGKRRYAIVIIWILAAVLTPPDPFSQAVVAIPLMVIYEISVIISKIVAKGNLKRLNESRE